MCGNSVKELLMGICKGFVMETAGYVSAAVVFHPWMLLILGHQVVFLVNWIG